MTRNILVLENEAFARHLVRALKNAGFQSGALVRANDALEVIRYNSGVAGVSVDFNLFGGMTGVEFAAAARALRPNLVCVLLSANVEGARKHPQYRPDLFARELEKPINIDTYARIWQELVPEEQGTMVE